MGNERLKQRRRAALLEFWAQYRKSPQGMVGLGILILFLVMALGAPWLTPYDPLKDVYLADRMARPAWMARFSAFRNQPVTIDELVLPNAWAAQESENVQIASEERETPAMRARDRHDVALAVTSEAAAEAALGDAGSSGSSGSELPPLLQGALGSLPGQGSSGNSSAGGSGGSGSSGGFSWATGFLTGPAQSYSSSAVLEHALTYEKDPPSTFSFSFNYALEGAPDAAAALELVLRSPGGQEWSLWESPPITGEQIWTPVQVDSRDIQLKTRLGLSPFVDLAKTLFAEKGEYTLRLVAQLSPGSDEEARARLVLSPARLTILGKLHGVLGADHLGADLWSQLLYGARISLLIGISTAVIAVAVGTAVGMISGYMGGAVDEALMRIADIMLSIPATPILIILAGLLGKSLWNIVILVAAFAWMGTARIVRSQTLSLKERAFIEAAKAGGAREGYVMRTHILPNVVPLVFASLVLLIPSAIITEATLSFLGLGDPRIPTWGRMLQNARGFGAFTTMAWWWILPPGFAITLLSLAFVFIGNTVDDILNPRTRERR